MIRLLKIVIALGLLWSAYWYAAGYGLRSSVSGWFLTQQQRGWQAEYATISTSGFPLEHVTALTSPALADPATGTAWQAEWLELESPAIWPGRQTLRFADTPQRLSYLDQTLVIEAQDMVAALNLHPGIALQLEAMALTSGPWTLTEDNAPVAAADSLTVSMVQDTATPETYEFRLDATAFSPGDSLRRMTRSKPDLPASFEALTARATVEFTRPWDRAALEESRPQPRQIDLELVEARWGALSLKMAGALSVDEAGIPSGTISLQAENWREMLSMAQAAGTVPSQAVEPMERVLRMLAGLGGNPETLDVQLNFREGYLAFGPLPLGPAPRIILR